MFWGSQWGTQSTDGNGDVTLSGDPSGVAPYLQELLKGLGVGGEKWSGVMTQYCDGVAVGATSCPASNPTHVAYPTGGALAGVWVDESAGLTNATAQQLGAEAVSAAAHFGNTTAASNRNVQYIIASPTGTHPDGFPNTGFCAWHTYVSSSYGDVTFTNLPYLDGANCGANFVNSGGAGTLDGVSIVEGHEFAETVTDQYISGWYGVDTSHENGDQCVWDLGPGAQVQDVQFGTGAFAMQPTWANDGNGGTGTCEISHPIVANPPIKYGWGVVKNAGALGGSYVQERYPNASEKYSFSGSSLGVVMWAAPDRGTATVVITSTTAPKKITQQINTYAASGGDLSFSPWGALPAGKHTVTITTNGANVAPSTGTWVAIDAITTDSGTDATPKLTGMWSDGGGYGYRFTGQKGATASLPFYGSRIIWNALVGPNDGKAKVTITGPSPTVPAVYTVDLYAAGYSYQNVFNVALPLGYYTIKITALGTKQAASSDTIVTLKQLTAS